MRGERPSRQPKGRMPRTFLPRGKPSMKPVIPATASTVGPSRSRRRARVGRPRTLMALSLALVLLMGTSGQAHGVSGFDALFLQGITGAAIGPLMYLGAKHMVTGYDHLAFLVGVIFFLYRLKDVALYVSLFTIGHSITLLAGVLGHISATPYVVDAIIGLSLVYKALDNMGLF